MRSIYQPKSSLGLFCFTSPFGSFSFFSVSFLFRFCSVSVSLLPGIVALCPVPPCEDDALHVTVLQTGEVTLAEMVCVNVGEKQEENYSRVDLNDPGSETETLFIC